MKKMKRLLALVMAMAMVLGIGIVSSAAETSNIKITNAGTGKFKAVQIVEVDPTKDTGWDIVESYRDSFLNAFKLQNESDKDAARQTIIKGMIYSVNQSATEGKEIENFDQKYQNALTSVLSTVDMESAVEASNNEVTLAVSVPSGGSTAGVWAINGSETGYNYSPMAAYIDFAGIVTPATGINAKKEPTSITKDTTDDDGLYEVGQTITYKVDTRVPYIPETDTNRCYTIKDTLTGANYDVIEEGANAGKLEVIVTVKENDAENAKTASQTYYVLPIGVDNNQSFSLEISDFLLKVNGQNANPYQNWQLTITYSAIAEAVKVGNTATITRGDAEGAHKYGSDSSHLISGTVTLTKKDADDTTIFLGGAEFVVVKVTTIAADPDTDASETKQYQYATFDTNNKLTGWVDEIEHATHVETSKEQGATLGTVTVHGLDPSLTYEFKEVKAPDGYSINETNATIIWGTVPEKADIANMTAPVTGTSSMADTKLASLPSTGGIGTTIFTVGGCIIMIAAAALYFASKRRTEEQ